MLTPQLRFPKFKDIWQQKKLGEVSDVSKLAGYEYTKHIIYKDTGSIIALRAMNIKNNSLNLTSVKYIDESDFSKLSRSKLYIGDLLFTYIGANIGDVALISENDKFYLAPNVARIRPNKAILSFNYLLQYFNITAFLNTEISKFIASSSQPALSMESIRKFIIAIPSLDEQHLISAFLESIDKKLVQLKRKKYLLEQYKMCLTQNIFNQEIRFKDNNGDEFPRWQTRKIGDVASIIMGQSPDSASYNSNGNGVPLIQGNADIKLRRTLPRNWTTQVTKMCKIGDLLLTVRAPVGAIAKSSHDACIGRGVCAIRNNDQSDHEFLYQFFCYYETKWSGVEQGSTFTAVSGTEIKGTKINIPCLEEQEKIANFLLPLDQKIRSLYSRIELTEKYKNGLLQQMFC